MKNIKLVKPTIHKQKQDIFISKSALIKIHDRFLWSTAFTSKAITVFKIFSIKKNYNIESMGYCLFQTKNKTWYYKFV